MDGTLFGRLIMNVTHGTQVTCKVLWLTIITGDLYRGVVTGPPHRRVGVTQPHVWPRLVFSTALRISCVTASGCETMDACDAATSSIRAFPRSAMNRCPAGGMARSSVPSRYHDEMDRHPAGPDGVATSRTWSGHTGHCWLRGPIFSTAVRRVKATTQVTPFVCCRSCTSGYRQVRDSGRRVAA